MWYEMRVACVVLAVRSVASVFCLGGLSMLLVLRLLLWLVLVGWVVVLVCVGCVCDSMEGGSIMLVRRYLVWLVLVEWAVVLV